MPCTHGTRSPPLAIDSPPPLSTATHTFRQLAVRLVQPLPMHGPMQASILALPPPDQWNDHVLAYLGSMGPDQHRGVMKDTVYKLRECLWTSMACGCQSSAYQLLLDVSSNACSWVSWCGLIKTGYGWWSETPASMTGT